MTTMDSDSESQDSDDGRRFRFEATRKDPVAPLDTASRAKSPKRKSKGKSYCESDRHYRNRKEHRSKHESDRKADEKDLRHSIRHSKHESWSTRQEDGSRNSHKDQRDNREASVGSAVNDRSSRNSRERSRDLKRQPDRDRSSHRAQQSREHSYERNHDERASGDKHKSRCHERHKHRSREKDRDRSHQSSRIKSSNGDRPREDYSNKHDSCRKILVKESRSQSFTDCTSPKNVERMSSYSNVRTTISTNENIKMESSIDAQDCNNLDLSQFDVLSEIEENISDGMDSLSRTSSPRHRKIKLKRHDRSSRDQSESREMERARKRREEMRKVNTGNNDDPMSSSSNNNPSAVSDSSLDFGLLPTVSVMKETCAYPAREKFQRREERITRESSGECSDPTKKYSRYFDTSSDQTQLEKITERDELVYGPLLPIESTSNLSDGEICEETSSTNVNIHCEVQNKSMSINEDAGDERENSIGPRLPWIDKMRNIEIDDRRNDEQEDRLEDTAIKETDADMAFGPALPPHLLQQHKCNNELQGRIIGPVLPSIVKLSKEDLGAKSDDDDEDAIGPLPADHPALRNSRVHEELDFRAQRIRDGAYSEEVDIRNKREEWMTELPPAQAVNLGLGPRKFRLRDGPDMSDRSCWTDTPALRAQRQKDSEAKKGSMQESDKKHEKEFHEKEADKGNKRKKSLLEIHQSKVAKKKRKEEKEAKLIGKSIRRPFDRDIDLQANRFDQAQKKTILMKAQLLDDRFTHGQI